MFPRKLFTIFIVVESHCIVGDVFENSSASIYAATNESIIPSQRGFIRQLLNLSEVSCANGLWSADMPDVLRPNLMYC